MKSRRSRQTRSVYRVIGILAFLAAALVYAEPAHAYVGPGAGFAVISSFLVFFLAFALVGVILLITPVRILWQLIRGRRGRSESKCARAVVIGLDGMSPVLARRMMDRGELPHFRELEKQGAFCPLQSTLPSISPVAWSTFQTGVYPDKHNIFDFLSRDRRTYLPVLASAKIEPPKRMFRIGGLQIPLGKPRITFLRKSQPFWKILGEHGVFSMVLRVPITFPVEKFNGIALAGMCAPDLRGTQGSFTYFTTEPEAGGPRGSGVCIGMTRKGNRVASEIPGPDNPLRTRSVPMSVPFTLTMNGDRDSALLEVSGQKIPLVRGKHSPWVRLKFRAGLGLSVTGICRFCLLETSPHCRLYVTPLNIDPDKPALPLSHPFLYAPYLAKVFGPFATLGLAEDTSALNEGILDESAFLDQTYAIHQEREQMFFDALDKVDQGLVACVFDVTDRVQHMFWRYTEEARAAGSRPEPSEHDDAVEDCYRKMDDLLGRTMKQLGPDDLLMVMSDHGFASFQHCVSINAWLKENGFLHLRDDAAECEGYYANVDWSRTKAFALGLGGVFINQAGRDSQGIVQKGKEAQAVKEAIAEGLLALKNGETHAQVVRRVYDAGAHYHGPYAENGPDLIVGFANGYRISWDDVTGKFGSSIIEPNPKPWSGDHCIDPELVPGVLFCNRPVAAKRPGIVDIAPTILAAFGVPRPKYMDGKPFLAESADAPAATNDREGADHA